MTNTENDLFSSGFVLPEHRGGDGWTILHGDALDIIPHFQPGAFDAVIDFDAALRDPAHPHKMAQTFDSGDHLHPGDEGNRAMADVVNLGDVLPGLNGVSMKKNVRN